MTDMDLTTASHLKGSVEGMTRQASMAHGLAYGVLHQVATGQSPRAVEDSLNALRRQLKYVRGDATNLLQRLEEAVPDQDLPEDDIDDASSHAVQESGPPPAGQKSLFDRATAYIEKRGEATNAQLQKYLNIDVDAAARLLQQLVDQGKAHRASRRRYGAGPGPAVE